MAAAFYRLWQLDRRDDPPSLRFGDYTHRYAKPPGSRSRPKWVARGFLFLQNGRASWLDREVDGPTVLRVGAWLGAYEALGAFKKNYVTTRAHGGFAVYFKTNADAGTFLEQCLLNTPVFEKEDAVIQSSVPKPRTARNQLPGQSDPKLSAPFSKAMLTRLHIEWPSPFGGHVLVNLGKARVLR